MSEIFSSKKDIIDLLEELDSKLTEELEAWIIGGANLIAQGLIDRGTQDIDVIIPPSFSEQINNAIHSIAKNHDIHETWINTMPSSDAKFLDEGWKERSALFFKGKLLSIHLIGRKDIIGMKLAATLDRERDAEDLLAMNPTDEEWEFGRKWAREYDANPNWPALIDQLVLELKKRQDG